MNRERGERTKLSAANVPHRAECHEHLCYCAPDDEICLPECDACGHKAGFHRLKPNGAIGACEFLIGNEGICACQQYEVYDAAATKQAAGQVVAMLAPVTTVIVIAKQHKVTKDELVMMVTSFWDATPDVE